MSMGMRRRARYAIKGWEAKWTWEDAKGAKGRVDGGGEEGSRCEQGRWEVGHAQVNGADVWGDGG